LTPAEKEDSNRRKKGRDKRGGNWGGRDWGEGLERSQNFLVRGISNRSEKVQRMEKLKIG